MTTQHMWAGALSPSSVNVRARMSASGTSVRLAVSLSDTLSSPIYFGPATGSADNMVSISATGLDANTRYYYAMEDAGVLDTAFVGSFKTHPTLGDPASYIFGAAGDAGLIGGPDAGVGDIYITSQVSNNPVFDTMRQQAIDQDWAWFSHLGDLHYRNISTASTTSYRTAYNDVHTFNGTLGAAARQGLFLRGQGITYVWDDHDFGPNDSNRTSAGNATANSVYRERVPSYTLGANGIYQSWQVGRVLYIASDVRTFRDPNTDLAAPTKTMLGTTQKAWMEGVLAAGAGTGAEALVWISPSRWMGGTDTWDSFADERNEMVEMFGDLGWLRRMVLVTADEHALGFGSGPRNGHGNFPMFMFASMDASFGTDSRDVYDIGQSQGRQRYGTIEVIDSGHTIQLKGTGWINGTAWMSYSKYVDVGATVLALDYEAGHVSPPLEPVDDDQHVINDETVQRFGGAFARVVDETSPLSVLPPPDGVGRYDEEVTLHLANDDQPARHAGWRVHLGTWDEARYPAVHVDLAANPDLADAVTALAEGDRLTVANLPAWLPPGGADLLAQGYTETIGAYDWDVEANASPAGPWTVARVGPDDPADAGPDEANRAGTRGCALVAAVDADDTEMVLLTEQGHVLRKDRWITTAGIDTSHADEFPFDLRTDGEVVRATACTPLAYDTFTRVVSPTVSDAFNRTTASGWGNADTGQAWTNAGGVAADYSVSGGQGRHSMGAVNSSRRTVTAVASADFDMSCTIATPVLAAGGAHFVGLVARYVDDDNLYYARLAFNLDQTIILTIRKRVAGVESAVGAFTTSLVHAANTRFSLRFQGVGSGLRAKAWLTSGSEPADWDVTASDATLAAAGAVGMRSLLAASNTNPLPVVATYDGFTMYAVASGWGTSTGGQAWASGSGAANDYFTSDGTGTVRLVANPTTVLRTQTVGEVVGDCDVTVKVSCEQTATGGSLTAGVVLRYANDTDHYRARVHFNTSGTVQASVTRAGTIQYGSTINTGLAYSPGDQFWLRARVAGHRVQVKVWPAAGEEPHFWHQDQTVTDTPLDTGKVGVFAAAFSTSTNASPTFTFDDFECFNPQRVAVTRSINTVSRAHAAGVAVTLAHPAVAAL